MKEYGCCPKFGRGDNSTYTKVGGVGGIFSSPLVLKRERVKENQ
jgi:hypothetical protein